MADVCQEFGFRFGGLIGKVFQLCQFGIGFDQFRGAFSDNFFNLGFGFCQDPGCVDRCGGGPANPPESAGGA
jgi:hypothetical protein